MILIHKQIWYCKNRITIFKLSQCIWTYFRHIQDSCLNHLNFFFFRSKNTTCVNIYIQIHRIIFCYKLRKLCNRICNFWTCCLVMSQSDFNLICAVSTYNRHKCCCNYTQSDCGYCDPNLFLYASHVTLLFSKAFPTLPSFFLTGHKNEWFYFYLVHVFMACILAYT